MPRLIDPISRGETITEAASRVIVADRLFDISRRTVSEGALAFIPTSDTVLDDRVWLAWCELGRSDAAIGEIVAETRRDERDMLDAVLGRSLDEAGLDVVMAVIDGLVSAVCLGDEPLPLERARTTLTRALRSAS